MPSCVRIERRNSYKAMDSVFSFQISISKLTIELKRHRFYSCNISCLSVLLCNFEPIFFSPHHVHAHEHSSPVTRFSSACSGIYLQHCTECIFFFSEHVFKLELFNGF